MVTTQSNPFPPAGAPSRRTSGRHRSGTPDRRYRRWTAGALAPIAAIGGGVLLLPPASAAVGEGRSLEADYGIEMVILGGYAPRTNVTVEVLRDGVVIGRVTTPTLSDGSLEIHHGGGGQFPAGDCWGQPYTPDIQPGDTIRARQGTVEDTTVVRDVFIDTENVQYNAAAGTITVSGHARSAAGAPIDVANDALSILIRFPIDVNPVPPEGPNQSLSRSDRVGDEINDELDANGNFTHTFSGYSRADIEAIRENPGTEVIAEWGTGGTELADPNELSVYSGDAEFPLGGCPPYAPEDQTPPSQVTGLVASQPAAGTVELDWDAATDNVGVTGYVITRTKLDDGAVTTARVGGDELFWSQSRVADGQYSYTVHAVDATGNPGAKSAAALVGVGESTPPAAPTGLTASVTGTSVTLNWEAPTTGTPAASYQVLRGSTVVANAVNGTTHTDRSPGPGTHNYTVRSRAADGSLSPASDPATAIVESGTPAAPTDVGAIAGNASATVQWRPGADGGSEVTSWRVQVRTGTTVVRTITGIAANATSRLVTGLTNGRAYNFRVRAVNAVGVGAWSTPSAAVTPTGTTATAPGRPVIRTAAPGVAGGGITATANWQPPATDGGSRITGYVVRALRMRADGTVAATTTSALQPATARSLVMTVPRIGQYRFTVQARNAIGNSVQSARSNLVAGR